MVWCNVEIYHCQCQKEWEGRTYQEIPPGLQSFLARHFVHLFPRCQSASHFNVSARMARAGEEDAGGCGINLQSEKLSHRLHLETDCVWLEGMRVRLILPDKTVSLSSASPGGSCTPGKTEGEGKESFARYWEQREESETEWWLPSAVSRSGLRLDGGGSEISLCNWNCKLKIQLITSLDSSNVLSFTTPSLVLSAKSKWKRKDSVRD